MYGRNAFIRGVVDPQLNETGGVQPLHNLNESIYEQPLIEQGIRRGMTMDDNFEVEEEQKITQKRKRSNSTSSRKRKKIDPKDRRYKEIIVRFIFRNLDRPIHSTYVSKCATHKKNANIVKDIFWELNNKGYGTCEKWRETENSSLFFYKNEELNEKSDCFKEELLECLVSEYNLEKSDVSEGFSVPTKGPKFKKKIKTGRWTKEEHESFLEGLKKHGRTNYRLISENFVKTRITQQVAEYSERYFAGKRKKEKENLENTNLQQQQQIQQVQQQVQQQVVQNVQQLGGYYPPQINGYFPQQLIHFSQLQQLALMNQPYQLANLQPTHLTEQQLRQQIQLEQQQLQNQLIQNQLVQNQLQLQGQNQNDQQQQQQQQPGENLYYFPF